VKLGLLPDVRIVSARADSCAEQRLLAQWFALSPSRRMSRQRDRGKQGILKSPTSKIRRHSTLRLRD